MKISYLRPKKLAKNKLDDILDIFYDYLNVITGSLGVSWLRVALIFYLV